MSRRGVLAKARHGLTGEALSGSRVVLEGMVYVRAQDAAFCRVLHVDVDEKEKLILPKKNLTKSKVGGASEDLASLSTGGRLCLQLTTVGGTLRSEHW